MYVAKFEDAVYVLHCFKKKTNATSKQEKALARARYDGVMLDKESNMKRKTDPIADNVVGHITPAGGNVFADLGFSPAEAKALQAQVRQVIAKKLAIKSSSWTRWQTGWCKKSSPKPKPPACWAYPAPACQT